MTKAQRISWFIVSGVAATIALCLCFTTWPTEFLALPLTVYEQPRQMDTIIVLGAGSRRQGDPLPPQAKERVQRGVDLLTQGYAPRIILAGGKNEKTGYTESALMYTYALGIGARADQLIEENQSTDTWENANNSLAIMRRNDWHSAVVVTSSYHTLRSCTIFHKLKATVRCVAAPLSMIPTNTVYERLMDFRSVVREYGAIVYFVLKHYL